ncbi:hypothetical protein UFOVP1155_3 [uncultured Caudovirales phage]|uniref:Uncharacterized protein n=1 Tax=uncultured Caudovirales phage TaxID=2100421 RepID=A0A6J5R140_9CAUD|nr:hypothetical protein UFOVP1155_3 [uncultured Caudovirales phage]
MTANTCHSCAKSYYMPIDDYGGTILTCKPDGESAQVAEVPCLKYQRERGEDDPEGDNRI